MHSPVDVFGRCPLDDALRHNHEAVAEFLISLGAAQKPDTVDVSSTAVISAASKGKQVRESAPNSIRPDA